MDNNHYFSNTWLSIGTGLLGGMGKYFLQMSTTPYLLNLVQAVITALFCGIAGVAGKELFNWLKKRLKTNKK